MVSAHVDGSCFVADVDTQGRKELAVAIPAKDRFWKQGKVIIRNANLHHSKHPALAAAWRDAQHQLVLFEAQ